MMVEGNNESYCFIQSSLHLPFSPIMEGASFLLSRPGIFFTSRHDSFEAWEGLYHTKRLPAELKCKSVTFVQRNPVCFSGHLVGIQDQCWTAFPPVP